MIMCVASSLEQNKWIDGINLYIDGINLYIDGIKMCCIGNKTGTLVMSI